MKKIGLFILSIVHLFTLQQILYSYDLSSISGEEDIYDLFYHSEISDEEKNNLLFLLENPLDLNQTDKYQLTSLPGINIQLAEKIIKLREDKNGFTNINELISISEISDKMIRDWRPFVKIILKDKNYFYNKIKYKESFTQEEEEEPYILDELILRRGKYVIGFLGGYNSMEDYHLKKGIPKHFLLYNNGKFIKNIIFGNYKVNFGSGVTLSNSRQDEGFSPDTGTRHKFYGTGLTIEPHKNIFLSYLHSAPNKDVEKEMQEFLDGLNIEYKKPDKSLNIGITYFKSKIILKDDSTNISWYREDNNPISFSGLYLKFNIENLSFTSEVARTGSGIPGAIFKIVSDYTKTATVFLYRYYEKDFINPYSLSFASNDDEPDNTDEKGIYLKIIHKPIERLSVGGDYDLWQHPSTDISAQRSNIQIKSKFTNHLTGEYTRTWKFEEIGKPCELNNTIQFNVIPYKKLELILSFKEYKENASLDRSKSTKLSYSFDKASLLDYKLKVNEEDINHNNKQNWEYYIQYRLSLIEKIYFYLRYVRLDYKKESRLAGEFRIYW
ncbi:MAG: helix-hairpin-helix domain-containing protein [Candidatus Firestonebacteria bacterium]|nr:helix-hairpin-helix domain-containing protein [Candidatus Firestonebacteria bacterium]